MATWKIIEQDEVVTRWEVTCDACGHKTAVVTTNDIKRYAFPAFCRECGRILD